MEAGIKAEQLTQCPGSSPPASLGFVSRPEDPVKVVARLALLCAQADKLHLASASAKERAQHHPLCHLSAVASGQW